MAESSESPIVKQILVEETEKIEEIVKEKCPIELNQKFLTGKNLILSTVEKRWNSVLWVLIIIFF